MNVINKIVRKVSDDYSSDRGEYKNEDVRLLRLWKRCTITDLISKSQSNYSNFYRNLKQSSLISLVENGFIEFPEMINLNSAREMENYFQEINIACKHWGYQAEKELFEISNPEDKWNGTFDPLSLKMKLY